MSLSPSAPRLLATALALLALAGCDKKSSDAPTSTPAAAPKSAATPAAAAPVTPAPIQRILGRWARSDGDYTLSILGGDTGGILQARYFNPKPINVSRAAWIEAGGRLQILVELNDVGYPGATYTVYHDTATDRLVGQYKQPAQQQTYDIEFTRAAPSVP